MVITERFVNLLEKNEVMPMYVDLIGRFTKLVIWVSPNRRLVITDDEINSGSNWVFFRDNKFFIGPDFVF